MVVAKNADALKKHLECFNKTKQKSSSTANRTSSSTSSSTSSITPNTDQSSVYDYVTNDDKLKTEIIWVLKCVLAVYSNRSCDGLDEIFARIFPDSAIAQKLNLLDKNQCILKPMASYPTSSRCYNHNLQNQTS